MMKKLPLDIAAREHVYNRGGSNQKKAGVVMKKYQRIFLTVVVGMICIIASTAHGRTRTQHPQHLQARIAFAGEVVAVDTETHSMTLKSGGNMIRLDISNPVLQGYGSLTGIKKGDRVGTTYTAEGITITNLSRAVEKVFPEKAVKAHIQTTRKNTGIPRRAKIDGNSFTAVDNNKDGIITPIELCVVIPNLTMEEFRKYDKNNDKHLDKAEFEQIKLH